MRDSLTGLYKRRYFDERLAQSYHEIQHSQEVFTVFISDIDNFKQVDDRFSTSHSRYPLV
jgi:diguanylate cyclase (GGDEF)-like protein